MAFIFANISPKLLLPHMKVDSLKLTVMSLSLATSCSLAITTNVHALGVKDGILSECVPPRVTCVSSQDDAPASFLEPWEYDSEKTSRQTLKTQLREMLLAERGAQLINETDDYLRFEIDVPLTNSGGGTDDVELFFPKDDNVVHFRSEARMSRFDGWRNRRRVNALRIAAKLEAVPVLRGRSSLFGIFESPFDEFGPTAADVDAIIERGGVASRPSRQ